MLKLDSIADAWKYYLEGVPDGITPETREKLREVFFDGFGMALHFWRETHGAPDTFDILQKEFLTSRLKEIMEPACAND